MKPTLSDTPERDDEIREDEQLEGDMPEDDVEDEDDELADDAEQDEDAADGEEAAPRPKPKRKRKRKKTTPIERPVRDPRQREVHEVTLKWHEKARGAIGGVGVALIIVALAVISSKGEMTTLARVCGILGIIGIGFWFVTGLMGLWAGASRQAAQAAAHTIVFALILLGILGMLNYIAYRHNWRVDISKNKAHALSEQTKKVVADLKQQVTVTGIVAPEAMGGPRIRDILNEYRYLASKNLKVSLIDPKKASGARTLQELFGDEDQKEQSVIVVKCGDREEKVHAYQPEIIEEKLTSAILAVTTGEKPKIYFLTGHGEYSVDPEGGAGDRSAWSDVKTVLTDQQYEIKPLNLIGQIPRTSTLEELTSGGAAGTGESKTGESAKAGESSDQSGEKKDTPPAVKIPDDCAALVVAGAKTALAPEEEQAIKDYLANNGHAVICIDVGTGDDVAREKKLTAPDFNSILSAYQIRVGDEIVVEQIQDPFRGATLSFEALVQDFDESSPVAEGLATVLLPACRPVFYEGQDQSQPNPMGGPPPQSPGKSIMKTPAGAWAEKNALVPRGTKIQKDPGETGGPVSVAVVYGKEAGEAEQPTMPGMPPQPSGETPRIVVFGSAQAFTDSVTGVRQLSNLAAITKAIAWCSGRGSLVSIPPKNVERRTLTVERRQASVMRLVHILIGLGVLGSGVYVWWRRR